MKALLIIDHGSRLKEANDMLISVAETLRRQKPDWIIEIAHMELASPSIDEGIAACVRQGATELTAFPYMLSPGRHATQDIPKFLKESCQAYPQLRYRVSEPFGIHHKLGEIIWERIHEAHSTKGNV